MPAEVPDERRLKLLFVCTHPAMDPTMHTPLMLQAVLAWMQCVLHMPSWSQRRRWGGARRRSATAVFHSGSRHCVNCRSGSTTSWKLFMPLRDRLGWHGGVDQCGWDLAEGAIWLAGVFLRLMPKEAEVRGLLALTAREPRHASPVSAANSSESQA
jgi:hypothetical protein